MDTEKRLLLLVIISIFAIFFYQRFLTVKAPHTKQATQQTAKVALPTQATQAKAAQSAAPQENKAEQPLLLSPKNGKAKDIVFSFPSYKVTLSSRGGVVKSYLLTHYKDSKGQPMELVGEDGYFRYYVTGDDSLSQALNSSVYHYRIAEEGKGKRITFLLKFPKGGLFLEKSFVFYPDYRIDVLVKANISDNRRLKGLVLGPQIAPKDSKSRYSFSGPLVFDGKKAIEVKLKKQKHAIYSGFVWTSLQSLYFTASVIPKVTTEALIWKVPDGKNEKHKRKQYNLALLSKGTDLSGWVFMGPKDYSLLKSYGVGLEENIRFGMFKIIAIPALEILKFIYHYVGNYGWAIILLTIVIKLLFHPLTVKGYKSMNRMQELQPYMKQLKKTYKDDSAALNREMMALYKKHKVNPMGGCLPLLLQIPVFFALYKVLMVAIELRHAPFIFWIADLSAKDPYYITPVLMGLTMFLQQKMTPMGDPTQAKMMLLMPVVLTFLFLNFPSGLVVYFLVNNIITIGEQLMIKKVYT
jgi:YidC/Oxa1 family membrane protein insertase